MNINVTHLQRRTIPPHNQAFAKLLLKPQIADPVKT